MGDAKQGSSAETETLSPEEDAKRKRQLEEEKLFICNVWDYNLYEEFNNIRNVAKKYTWIALDTEFPGVVSTPMRGSSDYFYQIQRCNVDILKLIQLGITFMNERGERAPGICTWQFNFKFSLTKDAYHYESIQLLKKAKIDFDELELNGIDHANFAELFLTSGLVCSPSITWVTFHCCYDFSYLIKMVMNRRLPESETRFFEYLRAAFPRIFDLKIIARDCYNLRGGLQAMSQQMNVERIGFQHQAGSDSLVTGAAFFRMKQIFFGNYFDEGLYCGRVHGFSYEFAARPYSVLRNHFAPERVYYHDRIPRQSVYSLLEELHAYRALFLIFSFLAMVLMKFTLPLTQLIEEDVDDGGPTEQTTEESDYTSASWGEGDGFILESLGHDHEEYFEDISEVSFNYEDISDGSFISCEDCEVWDCNHYHPYPPSDWGDEEYT